MSISVEFLWQATLFGHLLGAAADTGLGAGCSLSFTGSQKTKITVPSGIQGNPFNFRGSFSTSMWIKPPKEPSVAEQTLLSYGTNQGLRFGILTDATNAECFPEACPYGVLFVRLAYIEEGMNACFAQLPDTDGWHHMAYTWDNSSSIMRLYVNGQIGCEKDYSKLTCMDGDKVESCNQYGNPDWDKWSPFFHLGEIPNWGLNYMGEIDDFRLYTRLVSTAEVTAGMHAPPNISDAALLIHYAFDECEGFVATDSTGKYDGMHGDEVYDGPTLGTTPIHAASGAPIYGESTTARWILQPPLPAATEYEHITWSVLSSGGTITTNGLTANVTSLISWNAELFVGNSALEVGSSWAVEQSAIPRVVDANAPFELVGLFVGYQEARIGRVEIVYDVVDSNGVHIVSGAKIEVALNANQPPLLGNGGQAASFDGTDDYMGNFEFVLRHRNWTNDSSIYGVYEPTSTTPGGAVKGGESGAGNAKPVTVEFWAKQTKWNLISKPELKGASLGGMSVFSIGNSDTPGNGETNCALEQPFSACGGRFSAHFPWTLDHAFSYFDYGWLDRSTTGRSNFDMQPYVNDWVHIAFTADPDANSQKMYANGQLMSESGSDGPNRDLHSISLGAFPGILSTHKGDVDEFRVYERAKPQSEIQTGMHQRADTNDPTLLGYWHFDDCGNDGLIKQNCEDISQYGRPLTSAYCGQLFDSKLTPGWGNQPGANSHNYGNRQQLLNCKRYTSPQESDKASWPLGVVSEAPLGAHRATLRPPTLNAEESNRFTTVIDAIDPDFHDDLILEVMALDAPGVQLMDADGNHLAVASRIKLFREIGTAGPKRNPMFRKTKIEVVLPANRSAVVGSLTFRVLDRYGSSSANTVYKIAGFVCGPGFEFNTLGLGDSTCVPCQAGTFSPGTGGLCQASPTGTFVESIGSSQPTVCPHGTFADNVGSTLCQKCRPGYFAAEVGMRNCDACPVGKFADTASSSMCKNCGGSSSYATLQKTELNGVLQWVPLVGATQESDCGCMATTRPDPNSNTKSECIECGEGLDCRGKTDVVVLSGYSSAEDISVFRCSGSEKRCKGGPPGDTCSFGRTGVSCFECKPGHSPQEDGTCSPCEGADTAPFVLACIGLFLVMCVVYHVLDTQDHTKKSHAMVWMALTISIAVSVVQYLGIIGVLSLDWPEPVKALLQLVRLFNFDIEILRMDCVAATSPLSRFTLKVCAILVCLVGMLVIHVGFVIVRYGGKFVDRMPSLIGCVGTIFMVFYIAVLSTLVAPMQCVHNPNGKMTIQKYQSEICWEGGQQMAMVGVGCVAVWLPLLFLAWCGYVVLQFKGRMRQGDLQFLRGYAFLFFRYKTEVYWYPMVHLIRSVIIALAPVLPNVVAQILILNVVMLAQLVLLVQLKPWRVENTNYLEVAFTVAILLVLSGASFIADVEAKEPLAIFVMVVILTVFAALFASVVGAVYKWFLLRSDKCFDFFLCHYKIAAGSFARLLKIHLRETGKIKNGVFVDTDDLLDLDKLFDYVGSMTDTFVVLMSSGITLRPWCLGEIVTCHLHKIPVIQIIFRDYDKPTEKFIIDYKSHLPDISGLAERGINLSMIQDAVRWIIECPSVVLPDLLTQHTLVDLADMLVQGVKGKSVALPTSVKADHTKNPGAGILVDISNTSALSSALVLSKLLWRYYAQDLDKAPVVLSSTESFDSVKCVLIMCTNGAFQTTQVLTVLLFLGKKNTVRYVPILADEHFRFPTSTFLDENRESASRVHKDPDSLLHLVKSVFLSIAVVFQPEAYASTEEVLGAKAHEIKDRLETGHSTLSWQEAIKHVDTTKEERPIAGTMELDAGQIDDGIEVVSDYDANDIPI